MQRVSSLLIGCAVFSMAWELFRQRLSKKAQKRTRHYRKVVWEIPNKFQEKLKIHIARQLAVRSRHYGFWAFIEIYWVFPRLDYLSALSRTHLRFFRTTFVDAVGTHDLIFLYLLRNHIGSRDCLADIERRRNKQ